MNARFLLTGNKRDIFKSFERDSDHLQPVNVFLNRKIEFFRIRFYRAIATMQLRINNTIF